MDVHVKMSMLNICTLHSLILIYAGIDISLATLLTLGMIRLYRLNRNAVAALGSAAAGATRSVVNTFRGKAQGY